MRLQIEKNLIDATAYIALAGRLDTGTATELEAVLSEVMPRISALVFDFEKLEYVSSAGLRVILKTQKEMVRRGGMKLIHVPDAVMEVFEFTGFADLLTIEA